MLPFSLGTLITTLLHTIFSFYFSFISFRCFIPATRAMIIRVWDWLRYHHASTTAGRSYFLGRELEGWAENCLSGSATGKTTWGGLEDLELDTTGWGTLGPWDFGLGAHTGVTRNIEQGLWGIALYCIRSLQLACFRTSPGRPPCQMAPALSQRLPIIDRS